MIRPALWSIWILQHQPMKLGLLIKRLCLEQCILQLEINDRTTSRRNRRRTALPPQCQRPVGMLESLVNLLKELARTLEPR